MRAQLSLLFGGALAAASTHGASASILVTYNGPSGLKAEAEFTVVNPTTLQVRLRNLSTGVPGGFSNSDQILTGVSWDFIQAISITGGSVMTGPNSQSLNFSILNVGPNADVSGEWGYGNTDGSGALSNFFSTNGAQATPFGGANLDSTVNIDGPQAGLVANPVIVPLAGLGAIQDEVIATLNLSGSITEAKLLADLLINHTFVEYGSDAAFVEGQVPAPAAVALLGVAGALGHRRRRRG